MTRLDIINAFRAENPEVTERVISDIVLQGWCLSGDKEVCAILRCITGDLVFNSILSTDSYSTKYDLTILIDKFYDINEYPGGGISYDNKRIYPKSIAQLDKESPGWRTRSAGTPKNYYRDGKYIGFDRPIAEVKEIRVYSVLVSDDFNNDNIIPFNQLTYLEPFHWAIVLFLQKKAKAKIGKTNEALQAQKEYSDYLAWAKKMIGGGKFTPIFYQKKANT